MYFKLICLRGIIYFLLAKWKGRLCLYHQWFDFYSPGHESYGSVTLSKNYSGDLKNSLSLLLANYRVVFRCYCFLFFSSLICFLWTLFKKFEHFSVLNIEKKKNTSHRHRRELFLEESCFGRVKSQGFLVNKSILGKFLNVDLI